MKFEVIKIGVDHRHKICVLQAALYVSISLWEILVGEVLSSSTTFLELFLPLTAFLTW